jgi:MFS family permease
MNGLSVMAMYLLTPDQYVGICILTALGAFGGGLYHPVANLLLTKTFSENKGKALGVSGAGACAAFIVAPFLASFLVRHEICDWQQICLIYGAVGVAAGISAWLLVPLDDPPPHVVTDAHADVLSLPQDSGLKPVLLFAGFLTFVVGAREMASWGTTAITQQFVATTYSTPVDSGLLLAAIFIPGLLVQPIAGRLSDTLGRERVVSLAFLMMGVMLLLLPLTPASIIILPYMLLGAAMTATVPTLEALVADRAPLRYRGLVYGVVITTGFGLGALGPLVVGFVADAGHRTPLAYRHAFWTLSILGAISFVLALLLKPLARKLDVERFGLKASAPRPVVVADAALTAQLSTENS